MQTATSYLQRGVCSHDQSEAAPLELSNLARAPSPSCRDRSCLVTRVCPSFEIQILLCEIVRMVCWCGHAYLSLVRYAGNWRSRKSRQGGNKRPQDYGDAWILDLNWIFSIMFLSLWNVTGVAQRKLFAPGRSKPRGEIVYLAPPKHTRT